VLLRIFTFSRESNGKIKRHKENSICRGDEFLSVILIAVLTYESHERRKNMTSEVLCGLNLDGHLSLIVK